MTLLRRGNIRGDIRVAGSKTTKRLLNSTLTLIELLEDNANSLVSRKNCLLLFAWRRTDHVLLVVGLELPPKRQVEFLKAPQTRMLDAEEPLSTTVDGFSMIVRGVLTVHETLVNTPIFSRKECRATASVLEAT